MQAYCRKGKHALMCYGTNESHGRDKYPPHIGLIFAYVALCKCLQGVCKIVLYKLDISNAAYIS